MIIHNVAQGSEEWDRLRLGVPTASRFHEIVTPGGKLSKASERYAHQLLAEWYYDAPLEDPESQYKSQWMQRGNEMEAQAVAAYEFVSGLKTEKVGFVTLDSGLIGCSPDRLVGEDGGLEVKCPSPAIHMGHMVNRQVDEKHYPQVQGCMLICERKWWDVISFCPPFPEVVIRCPRDEEFIALLSEALHEFMRKLMQGRALVEKTYAPRYQPPAPVEDQLGITDEDLAAIMKAQREPPPEVEPERIEDW
jgi:hypothetical protein